MLNLKYYLRGLGIGVVVTALIMGILAGKKESISDEEVIERAKALGMTQESTLLSDTLASYEEEGQETQEGKEFPLPGTEAQQEQPDPDAPEADGGQEPLEDGNPDPGQETEAGTQSEQESAQAQGADVAQETPASEAGGESAQGEDSAAGGEFIPASDTDTEDGNFTIEINSGDSSYSICQKLEDAGLVETATAFDRYLFENGYDKRINTGVFEIPQGADMEKIAKILSRMD